MNEENKEKIKEEVRNTRIGYLFEKAERKIKKTE